MPPEAGPGRGEPDPEPPQEALQAAVLWRVTAVLALLSELLNAATTSIADLDPASRQTLDDYSAQSQGMGSVPSPETLFSMARVLGSVVAVVAAVAVFWLSVRLTRGRGWARVLLTICGAFTVFQGVQVAVGVVTAAAPATSRPDAVTFSVYGLAVVAALCAAVALWRQYSEPVGRYLAEAGRGRRG